MADPLHVLVLALLTAAAVSGWLVAWRLRRAATECLIVRSTLDGAQQQLRQATADLAALQRKLDDTAMRASQEGNRSASEAASLRSSLESATANLCDRTAALEDLHIKHEALLQRAAEAEANVRRFQAEADSLAVVRDELKAELARAGATREELVAREKNLAAENAAAMTRIEASTQQLAEQRGWFEEQTRALKSEMEVITSKILEEKSQRFTALNSERLCELLNPLKTQLGEFRAKVEQTHSQDQQDRTALKTQIESLQNLNRTISTQAENLTNALTHKGKVQGDWGEFVLKRLLEESGLKEGREYRLQYHIAADDDSRAGQRPDAVILMPEGRHLIIDSKVSLTAWTAYCAATDEQTRKQALDAHLASIRTHLRSLRAQEYERSPDLSSADFVVMFIPVEAAMLEALRCDESLYTEAFRKKIVVASPTTLFAVIKVVESMWSARRREEHADKIAEVGRKLYDKLCNFIESFEEVARLLSRAQDKFLQAKGQLKDGPGNAIRLAHQMKELGISTSKQLPGEYVPHDLDALDDDETPDGVPAPPVALPPALTQ